MLSNHPAPDARLSGGLGDCAAPPPDFRPLRTLAADLGAELDTPDPNAELEEPALTVTISNNGVVSVTRLRDEPLALRGTCEPELEAAPVLLPPDVAPPRVRADPAFAHQTFAAVGAAKSMHKLKQACASTAPAGSV